MEKTQKEIEMESQIIRYDLTWKQYSEIFDMVKDSRNWKYPVKVSFSEPAWNWAKRTYGQNFREILTDCIVFFTGSVPKIRKLKSGDRQVYADGYYKAIGA